MAKRSSAGHLNKDRRPVTTETPPRRPWLVVVLLVLLGALTFAAFAPSLAGSFLNWDDDRNLINNAAYRGLGTEQLKWAWHTYHLGVWQPLSWMLLGAEYLIGESAGVGGMNPAVYRWASLLLHAANVAVFFFLVVALLRAGPPAAERVSSTVIYLCAAAAAALFGVHPLRVEVVAWTSCQPYLPASLFYMLAVWAYLRYARSATFRGQALWLMIVIVCYFLAVASKAAAVSLPAVLLVLDVYPLRRRRQTGNSWPATIVRILGEKLPLVLVAILVSIWAAAAKDFSETRLPFSAAQLGARAAQAACGLIFYMEKTIAPVNLCAYYRLPANLSLLVWPYYAAVVGALALTVVLIRRRKREPDMLAAWVVYVVIVLPNLGLVQISQQLAADRYGYLAIMPVMVLLAGGLVKLSSTLKRRARPILGVLMVAVCAAVAVLVWDTRRQTKTWHDSVTLWNRVLELDPECAVAECNLGVALFQRNQMREASRHISQAINLDPQFAWAYSNLGVVFLKAGLFKDAVTAFERALAAEPPLPPADRAKIHAGLGEAYVNLQQYGPAWQHTLEAKRLGFAQAEKMIEYLKGVAPGGGKSERR